MKKLLKLLFVLSGTTTLPLTVIACKQEALNDTLKIIYQGKTKYNIKDFFPTKDTSSLEKKYTLTINESKELVQKIANTILIENNIKEPINWYNENLEINQKCYHFIINDGEEKENNLTWAVNQPDARFKINVSYQVGIINSEKKFIASQNINMIFYIKCGTSESDNIVNKWVNQFNDKKWDINNPINVDLTKNKITLPENNTSWSDLDKKIIESTYSAITNQIKTWGTVTWEIINLEKTIKDMKLNLSISVNLNDAQKDTNDFYVLFK